MFPNLSLLEKVSNFFTNFAATKVSTPAPVLKVKKTNSQASTPKTNPQTSTPKTQSKVKTVQPSPAVTQQKTSSSNAVMSREEARSGKVVVQREKSKKVPASAVKRAPFFVAQKDFSSSDDEP